MLHLLARFCLIALLVGAGTASSDAQVLDYRSLFGAETEAEPQQSRPSAPLPLTAPSGSVPAASATDYGQLTERTDPMLGVAKNAIEIFRNRLLNTFARIPDAPGEILDTLTAASPTGRPSYFIGIALFALLLLTIGRGVSRLYAAFIARPIFVSMQRTDPKGYLEKLPVLAYRILLSAVGSLLTLGTAGAVGLYFYQTDAPTLFTTITIFASYGAIMLVDTIWRMALAPFLPRYRLPVIDDQAARQLYRWLVLVSGFGVISLAFTHWLEALAVDQDILILTMIFSNLAIVVALIAMIVTNRQTISGVILSGRTLEQASWLNMLAMRLWAPLSMAYLVAAWGKLSFDLIMGIDASGDNLLIPYLVLLIGLVAYAVASYVIERVFSGRRMIDARNREAAAARQAEAAAEADAELASAPDDGTLIDDPDGLRQASGDSADIDNDGDEEGGVRGADEAPVPMLSRGSSMRSFEDLARRVASLFALGAGAWVLLYYWGGIDAFAENALFGVAEDLIDIFLIGYIAYHAVRIWIDQKIEEEGGDDVGTSPLDGEGGGAGATRLATLLPLIRNFVLLVILVAIALVTATELGVNVAPLFAGAGIVGLAIGFGSQALVRDILSGAFFLLDDAFRKGEYIDVGEVKGTVEKISLRSFQLRHHLGMLHTIPFGEITHLTNFSRDWVMMKLPLRVTYDTDVDRVRKLIKKLGIELLDDPVIGENFIQPLKSQGVIHMDDSAMIIRVKFMTKPGDQWVVRKRVFQEIRDLFAHEGIKFAHREVTVRIPDLPTDRPPSDGEVRAIGAAARRIGDQTMEDMMSPAGGPVDDR